MSHITLDNQNIRVGNIFCIARSYAADADGLARAREAGVQPVVFLKPTSALHFAGTVALPAQSAHIVYESELVVLIGQGGKNLDTRQALASIAGYGIGLDLTARDWQEAAAAAGLPWTLAKGFDGAACLSRSFLPAAAFPHPERITFSMHLNGELCQQGDTALLIYPLAEIIAFLSRFCTLSAGDLIYTGTPPGTGRLHAGDVMDLRLAELHARFVVAKE